MADIFAASSHPAQRRNQPFNNADRTTARVYAPQTGAQPAPVRRRAPAAVLVDVNPIAADVSLKVDGVSGVPTSQNAYDRSRRCSDHHDPHAHLPARLRSHELTSPFLLNAVSRSSRIALVKPWGHVQVDSLKDAARRPRTSRPTQSAPLQLPPAPPAQDQAAACVCRWTVSACCGFHECANTAITGTASTIPASAQSLSFSHTPANSSFR
jgi:hypothetical protein